MMPRMSGFQVCKKLKSDPKTRDIQILMVTAPQRTGGHRAGLGVRNG